jgi:hypothetical protein
VKIQIAFARGIIGMNKFSPNAAEQHQQYFVELVNPLLVCNFILAIFFFLFHSIDAIQRISFLSSFQWEHPRRKYHENCEYPVR